MRKRGKVDGNQAEIVAVLRQWGCSVQSLGSIGDGCPDLLVGLRGRNYLVEVKAPKGKLKLDQAEWHARWNGQVVTVWNTDEAIDIMQLLANREV